MIDCFYSKGSSFLGTINCLKVMMPVSIRWKLAMSAWPIFYPTKFTSRLSYQLNLTAICQLIDRFIFILVFHKIVFYRFLFSYRLLCVCFRGIKLLSEVFVSKKSLKLMLFLSHSVIEKSSEGSNF